ncbi:MAG: YihY family inner membrane protein [Alphaproteobacteria bacterium]
MLKQKIKEYSHYLKEFSSFLIKRIKSDAIFRVSSALSYTSLLAIVPLLSIVLAIFSAFPIFNEFRLMAESFILKNMLPNTAEDITSYITTFISASAKLTAIGIGSIVVVAILMLSTIENSFNFIFKAYKPRRITTKITLYWTFLTLGPLLLGVIFSLRGYLAWNPDAVVNKVIPTLVTYAALLLMYLFVPNKKIKVRHALIGAFVAVVLFAVLRFAFGFFMASAGTYKTLYGALAVIPIFLIWMYLSWSVVIFGAIVTSSVNDFVYDKKHLDNRTNLEHNTINEKTNRRKK